MLLVAQHPDTICEEELDSQGDNRSNYRHVERGGMWRSEVIHVAKARREPIV